MHRFRLWDMMWWVLVTAFFMTLSLSGAVALSYVLIVIYWDLPFPAWVPIGDLTEFWARVLYWSGAMLLNAVTVLPPLLRQVSGDEWGVVKRLCTQLIPSHVMAVIVYRIWYEELWTPSNIWIAGATAAVIATLIVTNIVVSMRFAERSFQAGPLPPT